MSQTSVADPSLEADSIRFEIRNGLQRVGCIVSDEALESASGLAAPSTMMQRRRSFDRFRTLVNAAAVLKLKELPSGSVYPIVLTSDDLRRVPSEKGAPAFGSAGRGAARSG
ncbi:MAG: DUF1488 family protein [Acetobacteraceae bacterium]